MKTCVVCLTRGYPHVEMYNKLIDRTNKINECFKSIEHVIFHEGNIPIEHQDYIESKCHEPINFVHVDFSIPKDIQIPMETFKTWRDGSCYPGYHRMCEFNFCDIWSYVNGYDIMIRIDEDCIINGNKWQEEFNSFLNSENVFSCLTYNNNNRDTHELTNKTLPEFLKRNFGTDEMYKSLPATNLYFTRINFWKRKDVKDFIKKIKLSNGCIMYRWGDAPLIDICLNMFAENKIDKIKNCEYFHGSHNSTISTDKEWCK